MQHATQIARECGIPFINLSEEAWENMPDQARISMDGEAGLVSVLE